MALILLLVSAPDALCPTVAAAPADGSVTVALLSGRQFTAEVDARTDGQQLWLRWTLGPNHVLRPVDWDRVVSVTTDEEVYSGREFHEAVKVVREAFPRVESPSQTAGLEESPWTGDRSGLLAISTAPAALPLNPAGAGQDCLPRVRALEIEVRAVNWDRDVEVDGLLLDLYPVDAFGYVIPVRGTVDIELIGEETRTPPSRDPFVRIARWTEQLSVHDFFGHGAQFRLPFQGVHPEFNPGWASKGLVHVRLSVPGEGVFEASESTVRVRPYSAWRDRLEQTTGRRFLELERTGRRN